MTPKVDIFAIGEPLMEFSARDDGAGPVYVPGYGGDVANCVVAAARHGARTALFTALGDDAFGRDFLDLWDREGVDRSSVLVREGGRTGVYFVTYGQGGHAFSYARDGSAASRMTTAELPLDRIERAGVLHASGISQAISTTACDAVFAAMAHARANGVLVSYDTNLRLPLWPLERARAVIQAAAAMTDILLPGLDDAQALTGESRPETICERYLALGARIVALTLGGDGTLVATPERQERIGARKVEMVDATGAGDAFDGAFLAEYLRTRDPFRAGAYANAAAALSVTGRGAVAPLPRRAEVEALLAG